MLNKNYDYEAKTNQDKRLIEQKKNLLVLTFHYLISQGYIEAASCLQEECGFRDYLDRFDVADNMSLHIILQGYETYYNETRFQAPKFIRKKEEDIGTKLLPSLPSTNSRQEKFLQNQNANKKKGVTKPSTSSMNKIVGYGNVDDLDVKETIKNDKESNLNSKGSSSVKKENNPKIEVVGQMMYVNKNYSTKEVNKLDDEEKERNKGFDEQKEK